MHKCLIYMGHTEAFAKELLATEYKSIGEELMRRLYIDQHELYHDGEFRKGCDICDKEKDEGWTTPSA